MGALTVHEQIRSKNARRASRTPGPEGRTWPEEVDEHLALTHDPDPRVRKEAVHALCPCSVRANNDQVWDRLIEMVEDPDVGVRAQVFHTLADGSPREREEDVVAALGKMQQDPDPKLRRRARKLLAHYRRGGRINVL